MSTIAIIIYLGISMLICFQTYKWSERGIGRLFKIRRRNQMNKNYLSAPMGKLLPFKRTASIIKTGELDAYLASKTTSQDAKDKENKDV